MSLRFCEGDPNIAGEVVVDENVPSTVEAKEKMIAELVRIVSERDSDSDPKEQFRFRLCVDEVLQNAIEHGNGLDEEKLVHVVLFRSDGRWGLVVRDQGPGFRPDDVPDATSPEALLRESGRGLYILSEYMDEVAYYEGGRTAFLMKTL